MDVTGLRRLHTTIRSIVLLTTAGLTASTAWAAGPVVTVNIPAGDADRTLVEFGRQSKVQPLFKSSIVKGIRTQAVSGQFEASEVLERMLVGTGIKIEFDDNNPLEVELLAPDDPLAPRSASAPDPASDRALQLAALADHIRASEAKPLEEVVVTGTLIRGLDAITAPLVFLKQEHVKRTGYATVQDVLHALPFTSLAGPREDFAGETNYNRGAAINLRGLGAQATLVLVNGRRLPASGIDGDFIDVSTIPWSAVEKIEVMPDGASALYGSDAIGGVVNIILRKDLEGAETRTRLATTHGGGDETLFAQFLTTKWSSGHALFGYQFSDRSALPVSARAYAASTDKRPYGGTDFSSPQSNPGNILDPATFLPLFGIPSGQNGIGLDSSDLSTQINLQNRNEGYELLPDRRTHSAYFTIESRIGERVDLFAEGRFSRRDIDQQQHAWSQFLTVPMSNPYVVNPLQDVPFVVVAYSFLDDLGPVNAEGRTETLGGTVGFNLDIGEHWRLTTSTSRGQERLNWVGHNHVDPVALNTALADPNLTTAFNPFGAGSNTNAETLESIRTDQILGAQSELQDTNLIADGPVFALPAGDVKLAVGVGYRKESLERSAALGSTVTSSNDYARSIAAAFAEFAVPILSGLDLSLAARFENYNDFGSTFNPKFGLRWAPSEQIRLRSSWGTSFRAPALIDLDEATFSSAGLLPMADPLSPSGQSLVLIRFGKNSRLHEETATTWTAGIDLVPERFYGLTAAVTYFAVDYEDRILQPGPASPFDTLLQQEQWTEIITRNPSARLVEEICNSPNFFGPSASCMASSPSAVIDLRLRNLASTRVRGLDFELDQTLDTRYGLFSLGLDATYLFRFAQAVTSTSPSVDVRDTAGSPTALRMRGTADWYQHREGEPGLAASASFNYVGSYEDNLSQPNRSIGSWHTADVQVSYRTPRGAGALDDLELALGVVNVFDEDPPFYNDPFGYDAANAEPLGRIVSFHIQKNW